MKRIAAFILLGFLVLSIQAAAERANSRRNVEIEWEGVEGAKLYEIQVIPHAGNKKPQIFKVPSPKWSANIKPGLYSMQVRSIDTRDVPGDWSPVTELKVKLQSVALTSPTENAVIAASEQTQQNVDFRWESVPSAVKYKLTVTAKHSSFTITQETTATHFRSQLPVAENFEWNVIALDDKGEVGEVNPSPSPFELRGPRLATPTIQRPLSKYVDDLKWAESPQATAYAVELSYRDPHSRKWSAVETLDQVRDTHLVFDLSRPSGRYRLTVQAQAERRESSRTAKLEFDVKGGFKNPGEVQAAILRDSVTKPTSYYLILSYLITDISYSSKNYDMNASSNFNALGGTGRIGLGYQPATSPWGGFGIVDLSGFTIQGQNYTFASAEAHVTHKLEFGQSGLLLIGAGLYYKQLPVVYGYPTSGYSSTGKVSQIGPHLGFTYWLPITQRYGVQANARAYDSVVGQVSGGGGKTENTLSYQYGILGSYRIDQSWMGFVGYAFRHDEARYETNPGNANSFGVSGQVNSIVIEGNYLNLLLEYSF